MERIRMLLSRCAALFRGRKLDEELDEELRAHIELAVGKNGDGLICAIFL